MAYTMYPPPDPGPGLIQPPPGENPPPDPTPPPGGTPPPDGKTPPPPPTPGPPTNGSFSVDPAYLQSVLAYWATLPGANPSVGKDPNYWVQAIIHNGGLSASNWAYWLGRATTPEGSGPAPPTLPGGGSFGSLLTPFTGTYSPTPAPTPGTMAPFGAHPPPVDPYHPAPFAAPPPTVAPFSPAPFAGAAPFAFSPQQAGVNPQYAAYAQSLYDLAQRQGR